jgi:hypothetical protein
VASPEAFDDGNQLAEIVQSNVVNLLQNQEDVVKASGRALLNPDAAQRRAAFDLKRSRYLADYLLRSEVVPAVPGGSVLPTAAFLLRRTKA